MKKNLRFILLFMFTLIIVHYIKSFIDFQLGETYELFLLDKLIYISIWIPIWFILNLTFKKFEFLT